MKDPQPPTYILQCQSILKQTSRQRLASHLRATEVSCDDLQVDVPVLGEKMCLVLVKNAALHVTVKVFFSTGVAEIMALRAYGPTKGEVSAEQATDFIKELCNLIAGGLKGAFERSGLSCGMSLPVVGNGFDDLFAETSAVDSVHEFHWTLKVEDELLVCSGFVEVMEAREIQGRQLQVAIANDDDDGVEFL